MVKRYFWVIYDDWWSLMGGAAGLILGLLAAGFAIAGWNWPAGAVFIGGTACLVVCGYRVWARVQVENDELLSRTLTFSEEKMRFDEVAGSYRHFSTAIRNSSHLKTIKNCRVSWHESKPPAPQTPAILHRSGRSSHAVPAGIDLAPGQVAVFDFLRVSLDISRPWSIPCEWDPNGINIQAGEYEVQLMATGEDTLTIMQTLVVKPNNVFELFAPDMFLRTAGGSLRKLWSDPNAKEGQNILPG